MYIYIYIFIHIQMYTYLLLILDWPLPHGLPKLVQLAEAAETGQNLLLHVWIDVIRIFG